MAAWSRFRRLRCGILLRHGSLRGHCPLAYGFSLDFSRETVDGMEQEKTQKIRVQHQPCFGLVWFVGWSFTIGFLHLAFWRAVLAIALWPYYLGVHFSTVAR